MCNTLPQAGYRRAAIVRDGYQGAQPPPCLFLPGPVGAERRYIAGIHWTWMAM